jgi:ubiquinone/menaquinone biosynthesis C-methylase UbiE
MKLEKIKKFWEDSGREKIVGKAVTPTSRDPFMAEMERQYILSYLKKNATAIEVGCGAGIHSIYYAKKLKKLWCIDISSGFIKQAKVVAENKGVKNITFIEGSVASLPESVAVGKNKMDFVISQRCLINLPTWELQKNALKTVCDILKPGGFLLLSEGFIEPLVNLNGVRSSLNLKPIKVVPYNKNMEINKFETLIKKRFTIESCKGYGFYLLMSRAYYPYVINPLLPKHDSEWNEGAMKLSQLIDSHEFDKFSYNKFYALRKK